MAGKAKYKNQWQKENCDRVNLTLPKGRKAELQAHATARGESVNGFINRAIGETMERDGPGSPTAPQMGGDGILTRSTLKAAQEAAEAAGETLPQFLDRAVTTQAQRDALAQTLKGGC